jgi:hypothetical protein
MRGLALALVLGCGSSSGVASPPASVASSPAPPSAEGPDEQRCAFGLAAPAGEWRLIDNFAFDVVGFVRADRDTSELVQIHLPWNGRASKPDWWQGATSTLFMVDDVKAVTINARRQGKSGALIVATLDLGERWDGQEYRVPEPRSVRLYARRLGTMTIVCIPGGDATSRIPDATVEALCESLTIDADAAGRSGGCIVDSGPTYDDLRRR